MAECCRPFIGIKIQSLRFSAVWSAEWPVSHGCFGSSQMVMIYVSYILFPVDNGWECDTSANCLFNILHVGNLHQKKNVSVELRNFNRGCHRSHRRVGMGEMMLS